MIAPFALESDGMNRKTLDRPVVGWALVGVELSCYLGLRIRLAVAEAAGFPQFLLSSRLLVQGQRLAVVPAGWTKEHPTGDQVERQRRFDMLVGAHLEEQERCAD